MKLKLSATLGVANKLIVFVAICLMPVVVKAQDNSIKDEILSYKDSVSDIISKGRKLLIEKLEAGDLAKVKQIKDYLAAYTSSGDYIAFYQSEYPLILYWTQDYKELLAYTVRQDSSYYSSKRSILPQDDLMFSKLIASTTASRQRLLNFISAADLSNADKDFLRLNLQYSLTRANWNIQRRDSLNQAADQFLSKHPGSMYEQYVRKHIRYVVTTNWGLGVEFFSGYGWFTGNLSKNFANTVPIGVAFDVQYKKWVLYLRDYIGFSRTKNDIPFNSGVWTMNSEARIFVPEASVGYVVAENNRIKVAPFAGISSSDIGPTSNDATAQPALKDAGIGFSRTYTFGANADIKLGKAKKGTSLRKARNDYWMVRVRYSYNMPQFALRYPGMTGSFHSITVGIGSFEKRSRRKY